MIERHHFPGATVRFTYNPDWQLENGVSALRRGGLCSDGRFALLMGDHLFEPPVLERLRAARGRRWRSRRPSTATRPIRPSRLKPPKERLDGDRIVAIGKQLTPLDALDSGIVRVHARALRGALGGPP